MNDALEMLEYTTYCNHYYGTPADFVEQQLTSGRIQCAAMCRQLLADPNWVNKLQSGNAAKIHRCVRCNKKCLGGLIAHQGTRCIYDALNAKEQGSI